MVSKVPRQAKSLANLVLSRVPLRYRFWKQLALWEWTYFWFEAGKLSATTADHSGRDHCGGCSSSLSEWCCESVTVGDGEWIHRLGPPLGRSAKVGGGVLQRQPDQRRRRSIVREVAGRLDDLEQSRIDALDRVGCLDYMPHARRGGKKRNHPSPALAPERREGWMSLAPGAALEFYERLPSGVCVDCGVNRPEYLGFEFAVLPARVLEALSDQVRDAGRQGHGRRCRSQVRWSALLAMGNCELDIPKPASVDVVDDRQPELTRLGAFDPDPRDVTRPMWENAEREINRLVADLHVLAGLHPQRIEEHRRVYRLELAALPGGNLGHHGIDNRVDNLLGDLRTVR